MKSNLPIVTFFQDYDNECEGVLLSVDAENNAHVLSMDDMCIYIGSEWQLKETDHTCPIEYIEIKEAA